MSMPGIIYITFEQAMETHLRTIEVSGGGAHGLLNEGPLRGALEQIQHDGWYPCFEAKLTHLVFATNRNHCFRDGNKRIAIALGAQFLLLNGYLSLASRFLRYMENISHHLAAGVISKELLREIIDALLSGEEEDEALKLKILNAISVELPGEGFESGTN
jgi:death-on-curing protein